MIIHHLLVATLLVTVGVKVEAARRYYQHQQPHRRSPEPFQLVRFEEDDHDDQPHSWLDNDAIAQKLDTILKLVENAFGKTMERIKHLEQTVEAIQEHVDQCNRLDTNQSHESGTYQSIMDRVNKVYSIHQQTYQICKDALVERKPVKPKLSRINDYFDRQQQIHSSSPDHQSSVIVDSGSLHLDSGSPEKLPPEGPETETVMLWMNSMINVTLNQYVNRMQRKVAEELNVFGFQILEKLDTTVTQVDKISDVSKNLLDSNDQISFSLLEMKEQITDSHQVVEKLSSRIETKTTTTDDPVNSIESVTRCKPTTTTTTTLNTTLIEAIMEKYLLPLVNRTKVSGELSETKRTERHYKPTVTVGPKLTQSFMIYDASKVTLPPVAIPATPGQVHRPNFEPTTLASAQRVKCSKQSNVMFPRSCLELNNSGVTCNGVYVIMMPGSSMKHVYCDMQHNGGGWMVILRRGHFSTTKQPINFDHTFVQYRLGFGDMHTSEFWLGLDTVHRLTNSGQEYQLQIDLEDSEGVHVSLVYDGFRVTSYKDGYRLQFQRIREDMLQSSEPSGGALNLSVIANSLLWQNNSQFVSADRVNAVELPLNGKQRTFIRECAFRFRSGWWYTGGWSTAYSALKGDEERAAMCEQFNSVQLMAPFEPKSGFLATHWANWNSQNKPRKLKYVLMKIRPASG